MLVCSIIFQIWVSTITTKMHQSLHLLESRYFSVWKVMDIEWCEKQKISADIFLCINVRTGFLPLRGTTRVTLSCAKRVRFSLAVIMALQNYIEEFRPRPEDERKCMSDGIHPDYPIRYREVWWYLFKPEPLVQGIQRIVEDFLPSKYKKFSLSTKFYPVWLHKREVRKRFH